jgi:hypothetical protein
MLENPYESPQTVPEHNSNWKAANVIATIRASVAEIGLSLAVFLLLIFPFVTMVPGSEKGAYQVPALLGCAGLLHPDRLPFFLGGIALVALGFLKLFSN